MESSSEVVWKEQTKSSVSKKCVQEVSATSVQKLSVSSTSSLVGEKNVLSILGSDGGGIVANQMGTDDMLLTSTIPDVEKSLSLSSPIITSPSLSDEGAMKLKDEQGNEIGEIIQQKQQQQSVQASSSVTSDDNGSKSTSSVCQVSSSEISSSKLQQSATSVVAKAEESSSSSSNIVADKSISAEDLPENTKTDKQSVDEEVKVTIKKPAEEHSIVKVEETVKVKKEVEQIEPSSAAQTENEEIIEEIEEEEVEGDDDADGDEVEEVTETADGGQTKTITVTTVKKVEEPGSTKTVVTTSSVTKENKPAAATSEETKTELIEAITKSAPNEHDQAKQEEVEVEEEEEEEEEEETEEEDEEDEHVKHADKQKVGDESKQSNESSQQQLNKDQIPQETETQPLTAAVKEETVVDAPSAVSQTNHYDNNIPNKQENFNNTIKDIISSIDSNIQAEENIAALKEREMELLKKQQELAKEIEQQKLLAQKLANENHLKQQFNNKLINQENIIPSNSYQPTTNVSKYTTFEEKQDNNVYSRKSETFESRSV